MGGDVPGPLLLQRWPRFQSTPPHGGRRIIALKIKALRQVSIHAPAWGATNGDVVWIPDLEVSIHAPAWGATLLPATFRASPFGFNPRPRMGGDLARCGQAAIRIVSIHAPAWGATFALLHESETEASFNPRPRMGGDVGPLWPGRYPYRFNPRPRMGGDGPGEFVPSVPAGFNPRPRMGGDCWPFKNRR